MTLGETTITITCDAQGCDSKLTQVQPDDIQGRLAMADWWGTHGSRFHFCDDCYQIPKVDCTKMEVELVVVEVD
jgi:hypothetical protein